MNPRVKVLKQLVADGHYVIDQAAVAEAMTLRSMVLRMLPDVSFRRAARSEPQAAISPAQRWTGGAQRCARAFRLARP